MSASKAPERATFRHRLPQTILVLILLSLLALIILGISGHVARSTTILAVFLLILTVVAHVWVVSYKPARRRRDQGTVSGTLNPNLLNEEVTKYFRDIPIANALLYADAINDPVKYRGRVIERIEPLNRVVRQITSITIEMPDTGGHDFWFPLMMPVKGELQDDLGIKLDGSNVSTLTYREYLLLTIGVFTALITQAQVGLLNMNMLDVQKSDYLDKLKKSAETGKDLISLRARLNDGGKEKMAGCTAELDHLAQLFENKSNPGLALAAAAGMIRMLAGHYAILTVIPRSVGEGERHVIEYERYLIPSLKLASWPAIHLWFKDRVAALLGARPIFLKLDLSSAATGKSYHLIVMGPEGTYAAVQNMSAPAGSFAVAQGNGGELVDQVYRRFQRRRGQRYFHVYMRSIPKALADKLSVSVKFYEVPPGSLAITTAAALAAFVLIYLAGEITGITYSTLTGFPTLVLSFPAAAGVLAGFESRSTSLVNGTLSSRWSSMVTIAISVSASMLTLAQAAKLLRYPANFGLLGIHDTWWEVLVAISLLNALYTAYIWVARTALFYWLADRPDDQPNGIMELGG